MLNKIGFSGEIIEKGQSSINSGAKGAVKGTKIGIKDFGEEAIGQLSASNSDDKDKGTNEQGSGQVQNQQMSDEDAKEFLQDLYGAKNSSKAQPNGSQATDKKKPGNSGSAKQTLGMPMSDPMKGKTPEEIVKIRALVNRLHKEKYFDPTFNPTKQEVENAKDANEREEQEKKMEAIEEKNELKNQNLGPAVKQGTHEIAPGVSG